jgi:hypothetical protein
MKIDPTGRRRVGPHGVRLDAPAPVYVKRDMSPVADPELR